MELFVQLMILATRWAIWYK